MGFTLRHVAVLSKDIARKEGNDEFYISNSWLTLLENREAVPSIHKLFTLSSVYGVSFAELLMIFGVDTRKAIDYHLQVPAQRTHLFEIQTVGDEQPLSVPAKIDPALDLNRTTLVSRMAQMWGNVPAELIRRLNFSGSQYGYIGLQDHTLYPLLRPGTFVQIDPEVRKIQPSPIHVELDRPIYFVEFREGYACSWCEQDENTLVLVPHPMSGCRVRRIPYPNEAEIVGRVTGVAMRIAEPMHNKRATSDSIP
jgi:transcriptional regulator with XRE-family HTH domain